MQRNLSAGEIAGQVIAVLDRQAVQVGRDRINLVFMGMGEPFLNYDEFMAAVRLLVNEAALAESQDDRFHLWHCARHSAFRWRSRYGRGWRSA